MLNHLKFVMGAVAKKDLVPAMKHFVIEKGFVRSYNGLVALCSPVPFDIDCKPHAETLYKAIDQCEETITLALTPAGKLSVKSGKFRALVPCIEEATLHPEPEGEDIEFDGEVLLQALRILEPIIGDDAARPWQAGVLLSTDCCAYATCNVVAVQYWTGIQFGRPLNLPGSAIREMLRVNETPTHAQVTDNSITFHYESERWIRTQLLPCDWPDINKLLDGGNNCTAVEVEPALWDACEALKKFVDPKAGEAIYFEGGTARTHRDYEQGSSYICESVRWTGVYNRSMLLLMQPIAKKADMSRWPLPCFFFGDNLRGAIIGRSA